MVQLIAGAKGTGKTKKLAELAKGAVTDTKGAVVYIEKKAQLTLDLPHEVRLVSTDDYEITGPEAFYGFLAGIAASNYDIKNIYVDSVVKIVGDDNAAVADFIEKVQRLAAKQEIDIVMTLSRDAADFPESVARYVKYNLA